MPERMRVHVTDAEVEAVASACRVLVAVARRSAPSGTILADPTALRLLLTADAREYEPAQLATAVGLTAWAAQAVMNRLVDAGLLELGGDSAEPVVRLTEEGRRVVADAVRRRREAMRAVLDRLPDALRIELAAVWADGTADIDRLVR